MLRYAFPLFLLSTAAGAQQADDHAWSQDGQVAEPTVYQTVPSYPEGVSDTQQPGRWYVNEDGDRVFVTWGQGDLPNLNDYRQPFVELDTNGDGRLMKAELPAGHALNYEWRLVDRNGDGVITLEEFSHWR